MAKRKPPPSLLEMKGMKWKDYMKTKHWISFRKTLDTDDAYCQICGKKKWEFYKTGVRKGKRKKKPTCQFQVHHLHYNNLGCENREDVLLLCRTCHNISHEIEMASRTRGGVFSIMYDLLLNSTLWKYQPFKDRIK